MGDPKKLRKKYDTPKHPWQKARIDYEKGLVRDFGLRNKQEIWRADTMIRKFRRIARGLVGVPIDQRKGEEEKLIGKLQKMGLLKEGSTLDDALSLKTEDLLARRLQTLVWRKAISSTLTQARQLITHGHIGVNGRKVSSPGMLIDIENEGKLDWYGKPISIIRKVEPAQVEETPEKKVEKKPEKKAEKKPKKKAKKPIEDEEIEEEVEVDENEG
jgi:small subunit ribosomal protein S4